MPCDEPWKTLFQIGMSTPLPPASRPSTITAIRTTFVCCHCSAGCTATVHAKGVIQETGKKFWSTKDPGKQPFSYQAGVGGVIKGWDQGCLGMKVGETRKLVIPGHEGYGAGGFPAWGITPNATLEFTLECLDVKQ